MFITRGRPTAESKVIFRGGSKVARCMNRRRVKIIYSRPVLISETKSVCQPSFFLSTYDKNRVRPLDCLFTGTNYFPYVDTYTLSTVLLKKI